MSAHRGFTSAELRTARDLLTLQWSYSAIARALGRRSHDGIRRHFDHAYRMRRNAYQAKWMRENGR